MLKMEACVGDSASSEKVNSVGLQGRLLHSKTLLTYV